MTNNSYDPVAPIEPAAPIGFTASGRLLDEAPAAEINGDASDNGAASDDVAAISAAAMPEPFVVPDATAEAAPVEAVVVEADAADDASKPKRRGWWQRGRLF
jgi:ribonuclease E